MIVIGLTGGIGMGKSTVADFLVHRGARLVDTDVLARELVRPGSPALAAIRAAFGDEILTSEGGLDRGRLAARVFAAPEERRRLEAILHPRIRERWQAQVAAWRAAGERWAVVAIPLLFETGAEGSFDAVVCVACQEATQRERLRQRGWSEAEQARRQAAQWPVRRKLAAADYVIWTEGTLAATEAQCDMLGDRLGVASA